MCRIGVATVTCAHKREGPGKDQSTNEETNHWIPRGAYCIRCAGTTPPRSWPCQGDQLCMYHGVLAVLLAEDTLGERAASQYHLLKEFPKAGRELRQRLSDSTIVHSRSWS